jgi:hypothetical protein
MNKITISENQFKELTNGKILNEEHYISNYTKQVSNYLEKVSKAAGCEWGGFDEERNLFVIESNCGTGEYIFDITEDTGTVYLRDVKGKFYTDDNPNAIVNEFNKLSSILLKNPFNIQE